MLPRSGSAGHDGSEEFESVKCNSHVENFTGPCASKVIFVTGPCAGICSHLLMLNLFEGLLTATTQKSQRVYVQNTYRKIMGLIN